MAQLASVRTSRVFAAGMAVLALVACSPPEPPPEPVRAVRTQVLAPQTTGVSMTFAAEVRARTESPLGFRVGGKLATRHVDVGELVRPGQLLAELDAQDLRLAAQAALSDRANAQLARNQAAADHKRLIALRDQGFISSAQLEQSMTRLRSAQAVLDRARAQARAQGNQAGYARLEAQTHGVVTAVNAEPGQVLSPGMPVLRVAHDGPRDVVFDVPEDRLDLLRSLVEAGAELQVRLWPLSVPTLKARLRETAAMADPATRTFQVKADIGDAPVRLGRTATVVLAAPAPRPVLKLPLAAVFEYGGVSHVWLLDLQRMTVDRQAVQIGGMDGQDVVIASGLQAGQTVVTAGVHLLTPGQAVVKFQEPAAAATPPHAGHSPSGVR